MRNWKTTVIGVIAAALQMYAGGMNLKSAAMAAGLAALGAVAKDHDVSGPSKTRDVLSTVDRNMA